MTQLTLPPQTPISSHIWLAFDWKQAELYMCALFSKSQRLYDALTSGDFHRTVASWAFGIPVDQVTHEQREIAKMASYAWLYSAADLNATTANVMAKAPHLKKADVEDFLKKYMAAFPEFFQWVDQALLDWYDAGGWVSYLYNAKKRIQPADYLKRDIDGLRRSKQGRVAINTYGQNSVGLLLKFFLNEVAEDDFLADRITQVIPVFDAAYCLVPTVDAAECLQRLHHFATPQLTLDDFSVRFQADWKASATSWGELRSLPDAAQPITQPDAWTLSWKTQQVSNAADMTAPIAHGDVNPFLPSGGIL